MTEANEEGYLADVNRMIKEKKAARPFLRPLWDTQLIRLVANCHLATALGELTRTELQKICAQVKSENSQK